MQGLEIALYGLGGTAFFGIVSLVLQKITSKTLTKPVTDDRQKDSIEHVTVLGKEQKVISAQLSKAQNSSRETQNKIKAIIHKTAKDVQEALNEGSVEIINKELDEGWDDL